MPIKNHDLTALELGFSAKTASKRTASDDRRATVATKYRDPASGKTWTGRGKTPNWLATQLAAGRTKQHDLIK